MFMMAIAIVFSFAVAYIAHRGVNGSTSVNIAINVIQISALILFSVMALGYRMNHPPGAWRISSIPLRRCLHLRVATQKQWWTGSPRT
jgi:amino acid transporter